MPTAADPRDTACRLADLVLRRFAPPFPARLAVRLHIATVELLDNAVQHSSRADGPGIVLEVGEREIIVNVWNDATPVAAELVRAHLAWIAAAPDVTSLFAATIRARHRERRRGGLGLLRLAAENKLALSSEYDRGILSVRARMSLEDSHEGSYVW